MYQIVLNYIKKDCKSVLFCYICYMDKYKSFDKAYDKAETDRVFHCGQYDEKDMASYLASLGVNLIIGTHPHVIQPVTWIDNTLVIYSLGNFLSAQYQNKSTCTNYKCTTELMTSLKIEKDIKNNQTSVKITNVEKQLLYNYYNQSTWRNIKVIPFSNPKIKEYLTN